MASNSNGGKEGDTTTPDKKASALSKLTIATRLMSAGRSRKLGNELKISTPTRGPDTPPDINTNTVRRSFDEPLSPTTPGVNGRRQQLIQSRLDSVSPRSIRRFNSEIVSELDDLGSVRNSKDDDDHYPKMFESLDPCLHRTWDMFTFCVLEPAKCLIRPICNDKQQPGPGKANDNHAGDDELRWRQRRSRLSTGTVTIASPRT